MVRRGEHLLSFVKRGSRTARRILGPARGPARAVASRCGPGVHYSERAVAEGELPALSRSIRNRRGRAVLAAALVVTVVAVAGDRARRPGEPGADGLRGYRLVTTLDDRAGERRRVVVEEAIVQRPWQSRRTLAEERPRPSGADPSRRTSVSDLGLLSVRTAGDEDLTVAVAPTPATGDLRLTHAIAPLVEQGRLVPRGTATVLGRRCDVYRTGEPIGTGAVPPPGEREWADLCVSADGLVLDEQWFVEGRLLQRRTATEVETWTGRATPDLDVSPFSRPLAEAAGGGVVRPVDPGSRPEYTLWSLPEPPRGFEHRGRYEVVAPSDRGHPFDPGRPAPGARTVVDVYESGPDFIVVTRGVATGPGDGGPTRWSTDHRVAGLGVVHTEPGVFGNWLRVQTDAATYLTMRATLPLDELVALAARLEPEPRGRLVYLEP